ncbi:unnamed protein product, partial [Ectocarpus fasciculatus]
MAFNRKLVPKSQMTAPQDGGTRCPSCGGTNFIDQPGSGDRACAECGTVVQENNIVSTVQFSESGGSSNVVGQFVSGDRGRPSGGGAARGRGRFGQSRDSRETTIQNGKKKIIQVLAQLHLRTTLADEAARLFALCVTQNYVQGRKTMNIVAACVYIVCRQNHFPIMLIDISDKLAVNVYVLGKTFQKLIKHLNLQTQVPIVDPAMYIKRFAAKLDLGSKTNAVCMTALKIIGSMKRDFLASGRQPAGICCAALTLATRVNRIERSKEEIRKAVNVCDATVRKRLLEFEATPTSQLTVEELNKLPQTVAFPGVE